MLLLETPEDPDAKPFIHSCTVCGDAGEMCDFGVADWKPKDGKTHGWMRFLHDLLDQINGTKGAVEDFVSSITEDFIPRW